METGGTACEWMREQAVVWMMKEEVDDEVCEEEEEEDEEDFLPAYAQAWRNENHRIWHDVGKQQKVKEELQEERMPYEMAAPSWTFQEDKLFEKALAEYEESTLDRWERVAATIPGKNAAQVKKHYQILLEDVDYIEAGLIPSPNYISLLDFESTSEQAADSSGWSSHIGQSSPMGITSGGGNNGGRSPGKPSEQERRKGIPWTEEEHRLFLLGLEKYGKGDWRSISRNFVISRTPTQVASHAQKYFIRLNSINKDKRRSSIHDITNVNSGDSLLSGHSGPIMGGGQSTPLNPSPVGRSVSHTPQLPLGRPPIYVPPAMAQGPVGSIPPPSPGRASFAPRLHLPGLVVSAAPLPQPGSSVPMPHIAYTMPQPAMHH